MTMMRSTGGLLINLRKARDLTVTRNHAEDARYAPYCGRCKGLERMKQVESFHWKHHCGAEHDERQVIVMNPLLIHAMNEFEKIGWRWKLDAPNAQNLMMLHVMELLDVFSDQGHTETTAPYVLGLFRQLANMEILSPLTGEADEWFQIADGVEQNRRLSSVFRENGKAHDLSGKRMIMSDGSLVVERTDITFPYSQAPVQRG